jgi:hypothetical protein
MSVQSLALAADAGGTFAVVQGSTNASGSNVYLALGSGNVTWKALTSDGQDSSPSVYLTPISGTGNWSVWSGFSNHAGIGNVFFFVEPVGTLSPVSSAKKTTPPPSSSSSSSIPTWVYLVIAVVVVLVIIGVLAAVMMRRKKGGEPTSTAAPETPTTSSPAPGTDTSGPSSPPPDGGGSA